MDILDESVLVLNKSWAIIALTSVRNALSAVYDGSATIVDSEELSLHTFDDWVERGVRDDKRYVQGAKIKFELPEVIVLNTYNKIPTKSCSYSKGSVYERDGYKCQYCGKKLSKNIATIDHVIPRSKGGKTEWANCVCSCSVCNTKKADRTPEEADMPLLTKPIKPTDMRRMTMCRIRSSGRESWNKFLVL